MTDNVINLNIAREAAKELTNEDAIVAQQAQRQDLFAQLNEALNGLNPDMNEFGGFYTILALPDEQFALIAPVFLSELQKSYNNVNDKVMLAETFQASGIKFEDFQAQFKDIIKALDESDLSQEWSPAKVDFLKQILGITFNTIADTKGIDKRVIEIPIEYCNSNAQMPEYAHMTDAGMDVFAIEDFDIQPGETVIAKTGIKVAIPHGYELQVRPKSGRSAKSKLRIANTPGTIDSGYRQEIGIILENIEPRIKDITCEYDSTTGYPTITSILYGSPIHIGKGEKIAQLVLSEVPRAMFYEVSSVADDEDRGGGFGSTGLYSAAVLNTNEQN